MLFAISIILLVRVEGRQKLAQLDYELGERLMPINDALRFVLEKILTLNFYAQDIDGGVAA